MYECDGQLSIFDWIPNLASSFPPLTEITEAEAVRIVGEQIGKVFVYNTKFSEWEAKIDKHRKLSMEYSHYRMTDCTDLFLGVGYTARDEGGGSLCDTIEEAVEYFKRRLAEWAKYYQSRRDVRK